VWDVETGETLRTFTGHRDTVASVGFSPDGGSLVTGGGSRDDTVRVWESLILVLFPSLHPSWLGNAVRVWDVETGETLRTFTGHTNRVLSISFSPDGRFLVSGSVDGTVRVWGVKTGKTIRTFTGHESVVTSVGFSPDGGYLATGSHDKTARL